MTDRAPYKYLGNFAACQPWAAQGMSCAECMVSWTGCWDSFQCPKCGNGKLPNCELDAILSASRMKEAEILADDMENAVSVGLVMYDPLRNERSNRYLSDGEIALIITLLRAKAQDSSALMPPRTEA